MKKKMTKKKRTRLIRAGIQAVCFLLAPAVFTTAFSGVKEILKQFSKGEPIALSAFVTGLLVICLYTMVFGRFFCGYGCAFGTLGDVVYALSSFLQKKIGKKIKRLPDTVIHRLQYIKYLVLLAVAAACVTGTYDKIMKGKNPWDVFSMLTAGRISMEGYEIGVGIFLAILVVMALGERFFCQFLCPMGAVFSLLPVFPAVLYRRDRENCINGCSACQRNCPVRMEIEGDSKKSGECIQCDQCSAICPRGNAARAGKKKKGMTELFLVVKAAVLIGLCWYFF
jgi:polyferredoxin